MQLGSLKNLTFLMQKVSSNKNNSNCKNNFSKIILLCSFVQDGLALFVKCDCVSLLFTSYDKYNFISNSEILKDR